jgi:hypothetical protein
VDCHKGDHAAHGFDMTASGHNTTTYGKKGPYTKFDSSQGPLLKTTADTTVTNTWEFPTVNVFWPANDPSATIYAETGLTASSVVTCQDCHTGLNASGPHGASDNWGIDPNYPYPYDLAVLSHATVAINGFSPVGGIMERVSQTDTTSPAVQAVPGTPTGVICQKCHKLFDGTGLTGLSGTSNTAHGSHHYVGGPGHGGNQTLVPDGSNDCVSCHVAIPHGWKRPRLLINTGIIAAGTGVPAGTVVDTAPYVDPNIRGRTIESTLINPIAGYTPPYSGFAGVGMGPLSSTDQHSLDASGGAVWTRANCIACGAEHTGVPADTAKLQ